ncbi:MULTISPECIES: TetR/AcrR family transcriptional regulator [unclassified Gilliamella]|uniref:TetR/AcrR family transcriptional regulator n=1 Tax=unclassified Gilliamella TaxID=2685620 RepID=UPI002269A581|nr:MULTISPECIES: TetR/AcrR family transcriptional regulator [unclassified Gilliamella]MCX8601068.1 TetR/AcrR family transcriptional regulator [Gilliamella sp. B3722]MCX8608277.1 TetR/AcrR family transcriptional regulator [Gilliamella sp. B3771]MCX8610290.1 TetR/AcrR family transcriptional regulator [Gilliamella sp. B3891]MCX8612450.1 TetR/AcrR family transcriptional regulator [Gilliamella sp. B3773]MCX8616264.1 TetR/AcrR family transcriptional regulator [Gilliamella sp. B3770]
MKKTYELIIKTAEKLFYRTGFSSVGVDEIRDMSGCSKTTLYNHFGSKDKLIVEVLKHRDSIFRSKLVNSITGLNGKNAILGIFKWHKKWFSEVDYNGCLFMRAVEEMRETLPCVSDILKEHKEFVRGLIYSKLEDYSDKESLTNKLMVILEGLINIGVEYKNDKNLNDQIEQDAINLVLDLLDRNSVGK